MGGLCKSLAVVGCVSVLLSGCAQLSNIFVNVPAIEQEIADVQAIAQQVCGVLPAADSVGNIIISGSSALATAEEIATAICAAVTASGQAVPASKKFGAAAHWTPKPVVVNGVNVHFATRFKKGK
jgi:hypothetical protein